ncbi:MAG: BACON domain-containing protein [Rikenellaceae bacterium]|nr:BACON domain-containing protein [Rikenellaceae bacterium]
MKTKIYLIYLITIVAGIQLLPGACTDYHEEWIPVEDPTGTFTLSLELPRSKTVELATRNMTERQEHEINEMTLLLFTTAPGNTEQLHSTVSIKAAALKRDPSDNRLYTATVKLEPGTYSTCLALANSASELSAQSGLLAKGTSRSKIEEELLLSLAEDARWEASQANPRLFPMWGMIEGGSTGIVISNTPKNLSIKLFRMLASIDLIIEQEDKQGNPLPGFKLDKVHLCNFYRNGRIIPMSNSEHYDSTKLIDASLPSDARRLTYDEPLVYNGTLADVNSAPDIVIRREIYTFEQLPSDGEEESKAPFLIIEGEYDDTGYPSFYRIDFVERQHEDPADPEKAKDNFLPLIRNYTYNIVVKEILGPGYRSLEDAAICKPFNTVNEIFRFDDSDSESVQFDGKYFLSVSDGTIHYDKEESSRTLVVKTDSPLGWKIEGVTYSGGDGSTGWLSMDKKNGPRGENGEILLTADAYNATEPTPREAVFTVISGRMEHTVQVTQSHLQGISLEIVDEAGEPLTEIWFRSNPRTTPTLPERKFTVKWSAPIECKMGVLMMGDRIFPFETSGDNAIQEGRTLSSGEGMHTFTIKPTAFTEQETDPEGGNPFLLEGATVTFQIENEEETITKNIYIRHQCFSIVIDNPQVYSYMGHKNAITVYSNTSWILQEVETELQDLFLIPDKNTDFKEMEGTTGGYNTQTGDILEYKVQPAAYNDETKIYGLNRAGRKMVLTFCDTEGIAPDQIIDFIATTPDPNCYLVRSVSSVHIPLRKLFWAWERELDRELSPIVSGALSAEIIWQTASGLIQSAVLEGGSSNDYRDYTVGVTTGGISDGNALVAVRSGNEILWSFHIWVTDYDPQANAAPFVGPNGAIFMDHNLGSNGIYDPNNITPESLGLYYQWGRKDPFPGGKSIKEIDLTNAANQYNLYDAGNNPVSITYQGIDANTENNLGNSINNPTWFYTANSNSFPNEDWYTAKTEIIYQNDFLWDDKWGRKTVFDPCPAGWRVSAYMDMEYLYKYNTPVKYTFVNNYYPTFTLGEKSLVFPSGGHIDDGYYESADPSFIPNFYPYANIWDREPVIHGAIAEMFSNIIYADGMGTRKIGMSVRCVKDTYNWNP